MEGSQGIAESERRLRSVAAPMLPANQSRVPSSTTLLLKAVTRRQHRHITDSRRRLSIFESRSRATARASGFP